MRRQSSNRGRKVDFNAVTPLVNALTKLVRALTRLFTLLALIDF